MRGTVKIIGPRWCQNHDYAQSEAEGIVMVMTSPRTYNFKLTVPRIKKTVNICFIIPNERNQIVNEVLFILNFNQINDYLKMQMVPSTGDFLHNYSAKTSTHASMWCWREEHNTRSTLIICAPGTVILAGTVKIIPALLTNQMTGIFRWGIILIFLHGLSVCPNFVSLIHFRVISMKD